MRLVVKIRVVVNPHVDIAKLSRIYLDLADRMIKERDDAKDKSEQN